MGNSFVSEKKINIITFVEILKLHFVRQIIATGVIVFLRVVLKFMSVMYVCTMYIFTFIYGFYVHVNNDRIIF